MQGRLHLYGVSVGSRDDFEAMNRFMAEHKLRPLVDSVFPMDKFEDAMARMEGGKHTGKICVRVPRTGAGRL